MLIRLYGRRPEKCEKFARSGSAHSLGTLPRVNGDRKSMTFGDFSGHGGPRWEKRSRVIPDTIVSGSLQMTQTLPLPIAPDTPTGSCLL